MCLNLLRKDWISRLPYEVAWILVFGALFGYGLAQLRPLTALGVAALGAVAIMLAAYALFVHQHILFSWLIIVVVQIPLALLWSITFNSVQLYVENRLFRQSLSMYL